MCTGVKRNGESPEAEQDFSLACALLLTECDDTRHILNEIKVEVDMHEGRIRSRGEGGGHLENKLNRKAARPFHISRYA